ncbi:hypothetical protein HRI_001116600 [Hibiscus trionum]|uniref:HVA22-like protein n=1 Tax=Hibiscus trionum TaxID=183268 RepID=A0A9W7HBX7_HIBTR|nr:hypothetical protein HRI_001116600 [Hibiscus trionum]
MGSFLSRTLLLAFGYAYPAYECFKAVENNDNPEIHQLKFWCQYWVLVAILTVCEKIGDVFVSWLPLYSEVKLAFVVYLWYPKWKGTTFVYNSFLRPYVAKHETDIDRNLFEFKVKAREIWFVYWHEVVNYGLARFHRMLQCFSSQEPSVPRLDQVTEPKQLERQHLPVSSSLSVPEEQSTTNDLPTNISTASVVGNGKELQTSNYKGTKTKRRGIWRIFKRTKPHKK